MNPFVIDKGDSEEMLQRIGSLRRLIEVMVGESLGAERRASLDHALAGYYAQPPGSAPASVISTHICEKTRRETPALARPGCSGPLPPAASDTCSPTRETTFSETRP